MILHTTPQPINFSDPNTSQRAASDPSASVWVNASAGSGKTSVLTARVTRLLLSGVKPEKILCLTYTRAGAAEMANRVTGKLSKWAICDDATLSGDLDELQKEPPTPKQMIEARRLFARVLACPGGLRIRTIHSFCQEILSRFPIEAGLPPHFALIEPQEMDVLRSEVLDDLLRNADAHPEGELAKALAVLVAVQGESGFTNMLKEIIGARGRLEQALQETGGRQRLKAQMRHLLELEPEDTAESIRNHAMNSLPEADLRKMAPWLIKGSDRYKRRGEGLAAFLEIPAAGRIAHMNEYIGFFLTKDKNPFSSSFVASKEIRKAHPEIDDIAGREAARLLSVLERIDAANIAEITESVLAFGLAFAKELAKRKASRAALDYDDMILFTEKLLLRPGIAPWILYKLDNGLDHILVDEAQDTSRAQWNIVQALTEEFYAGKGAQANKNRTLFVVGDEKQSIYSFQNANPEAFLSLRDIFSRRLGEAGKRLEKIPMHASFRSARAVLLAVDTVFALDEARAGVSPEAIKHTAYPNRDGNEKIGRVEIWPLLKQAQEEANDNGTWILPTGYEEERDPQSELAHRIARKIKIWLTQKEMLSGYARPIIPGDIMILLRTRGRFARLMVSALKSAGVPVTGVDRMHLMSELPVMDLLAVLRFVLLPEDDLNLAVLLRSPLLGLSEEDLMALAIGREGSLWDSLKRSPAYTAAHDYLSSRLAIADFSTPFDFLSQLLSTPCPANADSGRKALWARLGDEAMDPIEELLNAAQSFGQNRAPSLQNFLHWLTQADTEIKRELERGDQQEGGQVRIMTVHASKGLEAPIVFLPDTTGVPRSLDMPKLQWSENNIPLFLTRAPAFGAAQRLWQAMREKQLEEYRRLFYVAMTRAANRLYICGWVSGKNEGNLSQSWYGLAAKALHPLHQDFLIQSDEQFAPEVVFADPEIAAPALQTEALAARKRTTPLPSWALQRVEIKAPALFSAASSSLQSLSTATPDSAFARGRIIHRLLQSLPDVDPSQQREAMKRFLAHPRHGLTPEQRTEITQEVGQLLNDKNFSTLFAADSLTEAPLTGRINGECVFRQVDRLCLREEEVWIVDYKTNRPPPASPENIPAAYRQQLSEYHLLLRGIYPGKKVRCFLLWTYAPRLMEVAF